MGYYSSVVIQKQGQEIIDALKIAFLQSLIRYHDANNCFPEVVVVFRDGVGDSQMNTVTAHEGQQFMNAFKVSSDSGSDSDSDSDSSSSGDSDELRKRFKELRPKDYNPRFVYIVVQKRISTRIMMSQGRDVVNPPPGTILDHSVTRFAYKLTHMYFNWPGTVRVPAPCQYAHKLVDLVGEHLHGQPSQELNDKLYFL